MDWSNGGAAATDKMPDGQSPAPPTAPTTTSPDHRHRCGARHRAIGTKIVTGNEGIAIVKAGRGTDKEPVTADLATCTVAAPRSEASSSCMQ